MKQKITWEEETNRCFLETLDEDGSITSEELTPAEAAQWQAENKF